MSIRSAAHQLDSLLRGSFTRKDHLAEGRVDLPVRSLVVAATVLGATYGAFMGLYALLRPTHPSFAQLLATTVKVPLLFLATLFVTFPSLYVFSALSRSRLEPGSTLKLLLAAVAVNLTVLASFGPVTGFFTLSTDSYPFMVLLNVAFFAVAGVVGLAFLARAMDAVFHAEEDEAPGPAEVVPPAPPAAPAQTGTPGQPAPYQAVPPRRPTPPRPGRRVLQAWVVIYAVVGAQMAWILRPFIGTPGLEFTFFRERGGNFLKAILKALGHLAS